MIRIEKTAIEDVFVINNFFAEDERGIFVKTFNKDFFAENKLEINFAESYYSVSNQNVIRGMHFQLPPHDHNKLVYVTDGEIIDVVLDLRKNLPTYGKYVVINLKAFSKSIYIPKGCAHGFLTVSKSATVVYNVSTVYNPVSDMGIRWDSFEYNWLNNEMKIVSKRDKEFVELKDFNSPF